MTSEKLTFDYSTKLRAELLKQEERARRIKLYLHLMNSSHKECQWDLCNCVESIFETVTGILEEQ